MTARELQDAVVADLKKLFSGIYYKTPEETTSPPNIYKQFLPKRTVEDGDKDDPYPYIIVRLDSGGIETQRDPHKVAVLLLIGIYDDDLQNNGYLAVMEIIEKIQRHYEETPALKEFVCADPFNWALQDEESYPYYFGACNLTFHVPAPRAKWSDLV